MAINKSEIKNARMMIEEAINQLTITEHHLADAGDVALDPEALTPPELPILRINRLVGTTISSLQKRLAELKEYV